MNNLIQSNFDYAALPVDAAMTARAAAERIKLRLKRTVEDIIEIGRELTAVKADLPHGQFLPWIAAEFEMSHMTATQFMNVAERFGGQISNNLTFKPTVLYALAAPSTPETVIEKAIEKAEAGEKVTVANVKDWKAELDIEKQRSQEWKDQWKAERDKAGQLQTELDITKAVLDEATKPELVEVIPADYETAKAEAARLQAELDALKKEQAKLINSQVKAKLHEYQSEVDAMEQRKAIMQDQVDRMKAYLASLDRESRRLEVHQKVIEELRLKLLSLAVFLSDEEPVQDADTRKLWHALADMLAEAMTAVRQYSGDHRPELTVIRGDAA